MLKTWFYPAWFLSKVQLKITKPSPLALAPLALFLLFFVGSGLWYQAQGVDFAFYQTSAPVAIWPAIVLAILPAGSLAKDIAERHDVDARRSASLIDIFSCVVQGLIPYGAQVLLAASIAKLSPLQLIGSIHYCWLLGLVAVAAILVGFPKTRSVQAAEAVA